MIVDVPERTQPTRTISFPVGRFFLGAFLILISLGAQAQNTASVSLAWNPDATPGLVGYNLYQGAASGSYTNMITVGLQTNATVSGLAFGVKYYFAVTAVTSVGLESPYSNEINYTPATNPPPTNPPPALVLSAPANGATYTTPATVNLAASVTPNGHSINRVQFFSGATLLAQAATAPYAYVWSGVGAGSYPLSAKVVYDTTNSLASTTVNVTVAPAPSSTLTFSSTSGTISSPFIANNGVVYQTVDESNSGAAGITNGGMAVYAFNIVTKGNYTISASVNAPNESSKSFWLNIDSMPTDPTMIWDCYPYTTGFENRTVSWRGNASWTNDQYSPTIFSLTPGTHQLIVIGREANVQLGQITISPVATLAPPAIALTAPNSGSTFSAPATLNLAATVTPNGHTITQVQFFNGATLLGQSSAAPYSFTWASVGAGSYNLSASAVYDSGSLVSSGSASVIVTNPVTPPPPPWQGMDIGNVGISGQATVSAGAYTVSGAGTLGGSSDSFHFLYQPMTGNGDLRAQITSLQNTSGRACAGVMIREALTSGSRYAFVGISPGGTIYSDTRTRSGRSATLTASGSASLPKFWARLVRSGSTITPYISSDGASWTALASRSFSMAANIYFGLAVDAGTATALSAATFTNIVAIP